MLRCYVFLDVYAPYSRSQIYQVTPVPAVIYAGSFFLALPGSNPIISRLSSITLPYLYHRSATIAMGHGPVRGVTHSRSKRKNQASISSLRITLFAHSRLSEAILSACLLPASSAAKNRVVSSQSSPCRLSGT